MENKSKIKIYRYL